MPQLLLISSTVALVLLVVHSWQTRGRFVTLAFFISATVFGILRGNLVALSCLYLSEGASRGLTPYIPQEVIIPPIGNESLQVVVGWVFSLYLAWTVSELILRRLPRLSGRVFMIAGLASLFMVAICWCMETTAVAVGWWYWREPTKTALFGNVSVTAMEAWFSVVPEFLIPFLVITCSATGHSRLKWLWVLAFPLRLLCHLMYRWTSYAHLTYPAMEMLVVALMMFSPLRMAKGEIGGKEEGGASGALLGMALAIFFGVITAANAASGDIAKAMTALPMLMLCLLAWRRIPVTGVTALSLLSVVGWVGIGHVVLWVLAPVVVFGFLAWLDRRGEPLWLRLAPPVAVAALSAVSAWLMAVDLQRAGQYRDASLEGDRLFFAGKTEEAEAAYRRAGECRPRDLQLMQQLVRGMAWRGDKDPTRAVMLFEHRLPRVVAELEDMIRQDPEWVALRQDLVSFYVLQGRIPDSTEQYREMRRLRPKDPAVLAMLGYFLLREGKAAEAEEVCVRAAALKHPPAEALVNLGVIRFNQEHDGEAKKLWEDALALEPKQPIARANLERLIEQPLRREVDLRFLARIPAGSVAADWVNDLAAFGQRPVPDRIRLFNEAVQFSPACLGAHLNLVHGYLLPGPSQDIERALWHARRAAAIVLDTGAGAVETRWEFEQQRTQAPDRVAREFDRLIGTLPPAH